MKMPPKEKVLEAYSAIADGRVRMEEGKASVLSSDRTKEYTVMWQGPMYASDDNATYWQGYPGYPVIAVLLLQGKLTCRKDLMEPLKNIPWKQLNDRYKRNYAKAAEEALSAIDSKKEILAYAELNNKELAALDITIRRRLPDRK